MGRVNGQGGAAKAERKTPPKGFKDKIFLQKKKKKTRMFRLLPSKISSERRAKPSEGKTTRDPSERSARDPSEIFSGKGSQQKMFKNAERLKHKFFIAEQIMYQSLGEVPRSPPSGEDGDGEDGNRSARAPLEGNKLDEGQTKTSYQYMSFRSLRDFIHFDNQFESKCFYELIRAETPVNEYYDIDARIQDWSSKDQLIVEFIRLRYKFFKSPGCPVNKEDLYFTNTDIRYDDLYITDASNNKKLSFHFIVKQPCYFKNINDLKYFMSMFNAFIGTQSTRFKLDMSVYNKNSLMRCVNSCKITDPTRVFRKYPSCNQYEDKKFFCTYHDYYIYGDGLKIPNHIGIDIIRAEPANKLTFHQVEQFTKSFEDNLSICTLVIDKLNTCRSDDYEDWFKVCCALHNTLQGTKEGFELFVKFSKKSPKFDLEACKQLWGSLKLSAGGQNHKPISLATLLYFYNQDLHPVIKSRIRRN